jgi:hypothetical protein
VRVERVMKKHVLEHSTCSTICDDDVMPGLEVMHLSLVAHLIEVVLMLGHLSACSAICGSSMMNKSVRVAPGQTQYSFRLGPVSTATFSSRVTAKRR